MSKEVAQSKSVASKATGEQQLVEQLKQGFKEATGQLERLKVAVEESAALGQAKLQLDAAQSEVERREKQLGKLAFEWLAKKKQVPEELAGTFEALSKAHAAVEKKKSSIRDLLDEAEVVAPPPRRSATKK